MMLICYNSFMSFCPYYTMYEMERRHGLLGLGPGTSVDNFYAKILRISTKGDNLFHRIRPEVVYYDNASPFYRLYPTIAEELLTTKIAIPVSEINLPFKSFFIDMHKDFHITTQEPTALCSLLENM